MATTFKSDIDLGKVYRDKKHGFTGHAVALYFYEHACERVALRKLKSDGDDFVEKDFDAPELELVEDPKPITSKRPGGPRDMKPVDR